jgi:hypothetical protein
MVVQELMVVQVHLVLLELMVQAAQQVHLEQLVLMERLV